MGIIPSRAHTFIGLTIGIGLLSSPLIIGFSDISAAAMVAVFIGLFIILSELTTTSLFSPLRLVPMRVHLFTDIVAGVLLGVSPFLFGFFTVTDPAIWLTHIVLGIAMIVAAVLTTTVDDIAPTVMSPSH